MTSGHATVYMAQQTVHEQFASSLWKRLMRLQSRNGPHGSVSG